MGVFWDWKGRRALKSSVQVRLIAKNKDGTADAFVLAFVRMRVFAGMTGRRLYRTLPARSNVRTPNLFLMVSFVVFCLLPKPRSFIQLLVYCTNDPVFSFHCYCSCRSLPYPTFAFSAFFWCCLSSKFYTPCFSSA